MAMKMRRRKVTDITASSRDVFHKCDDDNDEGGERGT
jgi:hypothetical protein